MEKRRFTGTERADLFIAAGGVCSSCGAALVKGFHADHVVPWSAGGQTDVANGQALCPACNLKKGHRMKLPPISLKLRPWQQAFFNLWVSSQKRDFLLVATPGSGKTIAALRLAHYLLESGKVFRIVIVTPTENLKSQWADQASRLGIQLDPEFTNRDGRETGDFHGVVVTFQAVAFSPGVHRVICSRVPTLVILDEVHHAGTGKELRWGDALKNAFDSAAFRLSLSGTPFRSDNNPIPFVTYLDNKSRADYSYGYGSALLNADCRLVLFPHYEGSMQWTFDGKDCSASFADELSESEASRRLRTALDPSGNWLPTILQEANARLLEVRRCGHPNAAGLVVAIDQKHAAAVALLLRSITGVSPLVVTYEDPEATGKIRAFRDDATAWIVAIKMVSEGVDIPRLRVGVYATNVISEMFFRQFVGRFVRMTEGLDEQTSYVYIPAEESLVAYAQLIKEERDHKLEEPDEPEDPRPRDEREDGSFPLFPPVFIPQASEAQFSGVIHEKDVLSPSEISEGRTFLLSLGVKAKLDDLDAVRILRGVKGYTLPAPAAALTPPPAERPVYQERERQARKTNNLVRVFGMKLSEALPEQDRGEIFKAVHTRLFKDTGSWVKEALIEKLREQERLIGKWLEDFKQAARQGRAASWALQWRRTGWVS